MRNIKKVVGVCKNSQNYITIYYNLVNDYIDFYEFIDLNSYVVFKNPDEWVKIGTFSKNYPICKIPTMADLKKEIEKIKEN